MRSLVGFIAWRYLRSKRDEGFISIIAWLSLIGIMLGVATLIIVTSVMSGFHKELIRNFIGFGGHLTISEPYGLIKDYDDLSLKIKTIKGVTHVYPFIQGQVLASTKGNAAGALVRGVTPEDMESRDTFRNAIIQGSLDAFKQGGILIGHRLADQLDLHEGDRIELVAAIGNVTAFGTTPRSKSYIVGGIFNLGFQQYDLGVIFMPLEEAKIYFKKYEGVDSLEIFTDNPENIHFFRHEIVKSAERGLKIDDWKRMIGSLASALAVERTTMFIILTMIILVASLNIISSMIMLVKTKGKDIGILRTMGATRGFIMRVFFWSGASVGIIGTIFGTILGVVFTLNIDAMRKWVLSFSGVDLFDPNVYGFTKLPAELNFLEILLIVSIALGLTFLATLYPSWKAAKLDPVEALRYE
ncbi:MAG: lipoprotein-releasing ABC transporter permease subunit [Alphaproteobacteria bacterium]|nr:lipoprotein-releasing ABC transporter permease subunit [Alphaproteobacteria bacterium]